MSSLQKPVQVTLAHLQKLLSDPKFRDAAPVFRAEYEKMSRVAASANKPGCGACGRKPSAVRKVADYELLRKSLISSPASTQTLAKKILGVRHLIVQVRSGKRVRF